MYGLYRLFAGIALPDSFEKQNCGRDGNIQGVEPAEHGYFYVGVGSFAPYISQTS